MDEVKSECEIAIRRDFNTVRRMIDERERQLTQLLNKHYIDKQNVLTQRLKQVENNVNQLNTVTCPYL